MHSLECCHYVLMSDFKSIDRFVYTYRLPILQGCDVPDRVSLHIDSPLPDYHAGGTSLARGRYRSRRRSRFGCRSYHDARAIHRTLLHWIPVRSDYSPRCAYNSTSNQGETISGRDDRTCF